MPKKPSAETELRHAKREIAALDADNQRLAAELATYRARATRAEQQVAEWRRRFDTLLQRCVRVESPKETTDE